MGWFKIKAGTNLGPQNYMYLSTRGTCEVLTTICVLGNQAGILIREIFSQFRIVLKPWKTQIVSNPISSTTANASFLKNVTPATECFSSMSDETHWNGMGFLSFSSAFFT